MDLVNHGGSEVWEKILFFILSNQQRRKNTRFKMVYILTLLQIQPKSPQYFSKGTWMSPKGFFARKACFIILQLKLRFPKWSAKIHQFFQKTDLQVSSFYKMTFIRVTTIIDGKINSPNCFKPIEYLAFLRNKDIFEWYFNKE